MKHTEYGVHIALSKYPMGRESDYINYLGKLYERYRDKIKEFLRLQEGSSGKKIEEHLAPLYSPSIFHVYSHFDIALVSFVDNMKFSQRVFEPFIEKEKKENIKNVSYQILSGSLMGDKSIEEYKKILNKEGTFLKVIQLKINNGLLIGSGNDLLQSILKKINLVFNDFKHDDFLVIDSFNWAEIILIVSCKDSNLASQILLYLRSLCLIDLESADLISKFCLYKQWEYDKKDIFNSHIFNDSQSYLCVNYEDYSKGVNFNNLDFKTQIEWQVKPGHLPYFLKESKEVLNVKTKQPETEKPQFIYDNIYFKNGKTDFLIDELEPDRLTSNIRVFERLRNNVELRKHIRKVKTKPLFSIQNKILLERYGEIEVEDFYGPSNVEDNLMSYKVDPYKDIVLHLRKLNISRNTRKKVRKVFYNYNMGIQDPILYIYFIDLHKLLKSFVQIIKTLADTITTPIIEGDTSSDMEFENFGVLKTKYVEDIIEDYLKVFEESLEDRILNNYNFEDINEFSIDVNSNNTCLISSLDSVLKLVSSCFRLDVEDDVSTNAIVTRTNETETQSNKLSVNYNIDHINNPILIYCTLMKEILNLEQTILLRSNSELWDSLKTELSKDIELKEIGKILSDSAIAYFEIDYKKYYLTFFEDTELYIFWHWTYLLQYTQMYSTIGCFDEANFREELFRLLLLLEGVDARYEITELECPIPELQTFWDRHIFRLYELVKKIGKIDSFASIQIRLKKGIQKSIFDLQNDEEKKSYSKSIAYKNFSKKIIKFAIEDTNQFINLKNQLFKDLHVAQKESTTKVEKLLFFKALSVNSFYSLEYIAKRFNYKINLLRRNFITGEPEERFLKCKESWFIDPLGGFFINSVQDRKDYMEFNNVILHCLWSLGIVLKKYNFINPTKNE